MLRFCSLVLLIGLSFSVASADEVILKDGSRLVGQFKELNGNKAVLETGFSTPLEIDVAKIQGISSDQPMTVQLASGDRAVGTLNYTPEHGQRVAARTMGQVAIDFENVSAIWAAGQEAPEVVDLRAQLKKMQNPWSAKLHLGVDGQSGNTDRVAVNGRAEIHRKTDADRLLIYAQGRSSRENGEDTVKEVLGGISLEVDVDEKWFAFGKTELEFDKFENLDLRARISGGVGYFVTRLPEEEFRLHAGIGFQHESFDSGASDDQAVADLGWDYRKDVAPWLQFTHSTTVFPAFEDIGDFRIVMENAAEIPLDSEHDWKLRLGLRNDYDAMPEPGIKRLDTYYFVNVVMEWQ